MLWIIWEEKVLWPSHIESICHGSHEGRYSPVVCEKTWLILWPIAILENETDTVSWKVSRIVREWTLKCPLAEKLGGKSFCHVEWSCSDLQECPNDALPLE